MQFVFAHHLLDLACRCMLLNQVEEAGMQEAFSSMFPAPRQAGVDALAAYEDRLAAVHAPTLLIHGREDRVIPLRVSEKLLHALDDAQLHVFGHCGHWAQLEQTTAFNRLVRDFLKEERA